MGNFFGLKSKKDKKMAKNIFEQEKQKSERYLEEAIENADPKNKRKGRLVPAAETIPSAPLPDQDMNIPSAPQAQVLSYEDAALNHLRYQLNNDAEAFLLNNILLSVQFFENYEREKWQIQNKAVNRDKYQINNAMIHYNKHVLFPDSILECVNEHVSYQRSRNLLEAVAFSRMYVIYDNVEVREMGDASDYSAALDVPYYKLQIEDCMTPGYLKLKKQEVLESNVKREDAINNIKESSDDGINDDTDSDLNDANETFFIKNDFSLASKPSKSKNKPEEHFKSHSDFSDLDSQSVNKSMQVIKETDLDNQENFEQKAVKPKKSNLKSNTTRYIKANGSQTFTKNKRLSSGSEYGSSGYGSILSSSSTVTESSVPKGIEQHTKYAPSSGVLLDECWTAVAKYLKTDKDEKKLKNMDSNSSSEEDCDEGIDTAYILRKSSSQAWYKYYYYLNSKIFMNNFIANFKKDLGKELGFSQESIMNALTHGATIYCDTFKNHLKIGYEIIPGLTAKWPNAANEWIIRSRKIIKDPSTKNKYQWPVNYMVKAARDFGCVLIPLRSRSKLLSNPEQKATLDQNVGHEQHWRITFPTAEQYLESFLAHSHVRCYLFTLVLHKTFMVNEMAIGVDASHIKNHLFWECEKNFAKWPEDRLGESLMLFLKSFKTKFEKSTLPNYYMDRCNEFENISKSSLGLMHWKLNNILEAPVMHMLHAINKLKYNSIGFYPPFNCQQLFEILTCKNPLYLANSNISAPLSMYEEIREPKREIKPSIKLPKKLETERRHLVLKLFIPHFIAMARSSEKFEAVNQAIIFLEQAHRLCLILLEEPGGDATADEYLNVIRDKMTDCQRKIEEQRIKKFQPQQDIKLPPRNESAGTDRLTHIPISPHNVKSVISKNSLAESQYTLPIAKASKINKDNIRKNSVEYNDRIQKITVADIHLERTQKSNKTKEKKGNNQCLREQNEDSKSEDYKTLPLTVKNICLGKEELKPSTTENSYVSVVDVSANKQLKETLKEDHGISANLFMHTQVTEQIIQLDDSDIEESYL